MRRSGGTLRPLVAVAVVATALVGAAPAQGAVTFGSTLELPPMGGASCPNTSPPCTTLNTAIEDRQITSPRDGVVVRWRVRADANGESSAVRLRVLDWRLAATSTGATEQVAGSGDRVYVFETRQPISAGDRIALEFPSTPALSANSFMVTPGNQSCSWSSLPDGTPPQTYECGNDGGEYLFNADIEPDVDCDGRGDETQDQAISGGCLPRKLARPASRKTAKTNGRALWLRVSCDLPGGNCGDAIVIFGVGKSGALLRGHRRIALTHFFVPAGSTRRVHVQLARPAQKLLRRTGTIKAQLQVHQANQMVAVPLSIRLRQ